MTRTASPIDAPAAAGDATSGKVKPLRIGIAGLGTVGCGVLELLDGNADLVAARAARPIAVAAVSARDRHRQRRVDVGAFPWRDNPLDLADPGAVHVVVELIGGADGPALALARATLARGLCFVTANKALIAHHGAELALLAERGGAALRFEAAVAGGIPIVKTLKEGLAANRIDRLHGILNGTANFILTRMEETGARFADALAEAQQKGYAEADPSFDIDGIDSAHKTAILASLAFGTPPDMTALSIEGVRHVTDVDIAYARELGYRIRLLGIARREGARLDQRVHACLVEEGEALAKVRGAANAIEVHGNFAGPTMIEGLGAGAGPTASAVVADLIEIARGNRTSTFSLPAGALRPLEAVPAAERRGRFYVRLRVVDRIGVMADIAAGLRDGGVSVERLIQRGGAEPDSVHLILTTHETSEGAMDNVLARFRAIDAVLDEPLMLRIEPI
ncbi:MAG: homoserine dehydrogenase [Alphaproteobacteria bacterium]|nr:MAG: homoserine dehydrogenase [Alphaproteobacteria bacterium]